jgi:hypothetical protein
MTTFVRVLLMGRDLRLCTQLECHYSHHATRKEVSGSALDHSGKGFLHQEAWRTEAPAEGDLSRLVTDAVGVYAACCRRCVVLCREGGPFPIDCRGSCVEPLLVIIVRHTVGIATGSCR